MTTTKEIDEMLELAIAGDPVARVCTKTMLYQYVDLIDEMENAIQTRKIYGGKIETLPNELKEILGDSVE